MTLKGWRVVKPQHNQIKKSSSLEMIQVLWAFFTENRDQSVEVSAEINGSLIFGILGLF